MACHATSLSIARVKRNFYSEWVFSYENSILGRIMNVEGFFSHGFLARMNAHFLHYFSMLDQCIAYISMAITDAWICLSHSWCEDGVIDRCISHFHTAKNSQVHYKTKMKRIFNIHTWLDEIIIKVELGSWYCWPKITQVQYFPLMPKA